MRTIGVLLLVALTLPACAPRLPPLAVGNGNDVAFRAHVSARFPVGSDAGELRQELEAQGFVIKEGSDGLANSARFQGGGFPCNSVVGVSWDERAGRITRLTSSLAYGCL